MKHLLAFPHNPCDGAGGSQGMTLRDYFACAAMQASFAGEGARQLADRDGRYNETNWAQVVADNAYRMADAMLARRDRDPEGEGL